MQAATRLVLLGLLVWSPLTAAQLATSRDSCLTEVDRRTEVTRRRQETERIRSETEQRRQEEERRWLDREWRIINQERERCNAIRHDSCPCVVTCTGSYCPCHCPLETRVVYVGTVAPPPPPPEQPCVPDRPIGPTPPPPCDPRPACRREPCCSNIDVRIEVRRDGHCPRGYDVVERCCGLLPICYPNHR